MMTLMTDGFNSKADLFCRRSVAAFVAMVWAVVASAAEELPEAHHSPSSLRAEAEPSQSDQHILHNFNAPSAEHCRHS